MTEEETLIRNDIKFPMISVKVSAFRRARGHGRLAKCISGELYFSLAEICDFISIINFSQSIKGGIPKIIECKENINNQIALDIHIILPNATSVRKKNIQILNLLGNINIMWL